MNPFQQKSALLIALLAFYCFPALFVTLWSIWQISFDASHQIDEGTVATIVREISKHPGTYTNILHQMIVPTVAAITAATGDAVLKSKSVSVLFLLPLLTIFSCIINALLFNIRAPMFLADEREVIAQFFINVAGNLSVYVMMLVGLKMAEKEA
jgi:hypothetical protein